MAILRAPLPMESTWEFVTNHWKRWPRFGAAAHVVQELSYFPASSADSMARLNLRHAGSAMHSGGATSMTPSETQSSAGSRALLSNDASQSLARRQVRIRGSPRVEGSPSALPGSAVELNPLFEGEGYVTPGAPNAVHSGAASVTVSQTTYKSDYVNRDVSPRCESGGRIPCNLVDKRIVDVDRFGRVIAPLQPASSQPTTADVSVGCDLISGVVSADDDTSTHRAATAPLPYDSAASIAALRAASDRESVIRSQTVAREHLLSAMPALRRQLEAMPIAKPAADLVGAVIANADAEQTMKLATDASAKDFYGFIFSSVDAATEIGQRAAADAASRAAQPAGYTPAQMEALKRELNAVKFDAAAARSEADAACMENARIRSAVAECEAVKNQEISTLKVKAANEIAEVKEVLAAAVEARCAADLDYTRKLAAVSAENAKAQNDSFVSIRDNMSQLMRVQMLYSNAILEVEAFKKRAECAELRIIELERDLAAAQSDDQEQKPPSDNWQALGDIGNRAAAPGFASPRPMAPGKRRSSAATAMSTDRPYGNTRGRMGSRAL